MTRKRKKLFDQGFFSLNFSFLTNYLLIISSSKILWELGKINIETSYEELV